MSNAQHFFSKEEKEAIKAAIEQAEYNTSGEVRVHIENTCKGDVLDRAAFLFKTLGMHKTENRNGVLFFLAVKDKKFAVIGDAGINGVVEEHFWEEIKHTMAVNFKHGSFTKGLIAGIEITGKKLKKYFPYQKDDVNELSDEISFND